MNIEAVRLKRAAVKYAQLGMHVFPICPGGKIPYPGSHAELDGTNDPAEVSVLWSELPGSNIGWALRFDPGAFVLDVDARNGGCEYMSNRPPMPETVTVVTPSRGGSQHYWLQTTPDLAQVRSKGLRDQYATKDGGRFEDAVDVKGLPLGYVLLPPSQTDKGRYYFESGLSPLEVDMAECPRWLERELTSAGTGRKAKTGKARTANVDPQSFYMGRLFAALGDLGKQCRPGVFVVQCPNADQHSGKPRRFAGDAVIFAPELGSTRDRGSFFCAHAGCSEVGRAL